MADQNWWTDKELLLEALRTHGNCAAAAKASTDAGVTVHKSTLRDWCRKFSIPLTKRQFSLVGETPKNAPLEVELDRTTEAVHALLQKSTSNNRYSISEIADELDISPRRVRTSLEDLRQKGYRIPDSDEQIHIQKVLPNRTNLHKSLLEGNEITIGVVSDTHLSSNEEALSELHLAYDIFEERGITEVLHAGDWTCGVDIFRGQVSEIKNHTFESQVEYLVEHYPKRDGIVTRGISGNHDIEGGFGRIGANPVVALANQRDDIEFLGDYSAWINYGPDEENPCWIHLLHGKGGMSYSYSYKAQKLADGYRAERMPALLAVGHWHVRGAFEARGVQVLFPACFEWQSPFLTRLGLSPAVGFHILTLTIGDDGTLVKMIPEYFRFTEGRTADEQAQEMVL
jgi:predicted phosphodiesterase/biotin operon repressor